MAQETFATRWFIHAPAEDIYAHLADPNHYIGLSPLITAVSDVEQSVDAQGLTVYHYRSVEQFRFFGWLRYDNRLRVTMTLTRPNQQLVSDVDSPLNVHVRFTVDLEPGDGGTWLTETVSAQMPAIVRGYVVREAKWVQEERARILKARMETAGSAPPV
ncbi:MAG TPA: SRPBCC family protein [Phototrophicaceae bacterium]|nr:SRPBCC family protein [Phototrophicaceae bacterium]